MLPEKKLKELENSAKEWKCSSYGWGDINDAPTPAISNVGIQWEQGRMWTLKMQ